MNYSEIKNYKGLIFDLDGTLINSMPYHALAWKQVAYEHGFDIDVNDAFKYQGVYFSTREGAERAIEEVVKPFMKEHPEFVW